MPLHFYSLTIYYYNILVLLCLQCLHYSDGTSSFPFKVLNLSHNPIGDKGMRKLQRFIVKASLLTHLDLDECNIGDMGLALLSEFFMCLPLRYLRVSNNGITDRGERL